MPTSFFFSVLLLPLLHPLPHHPDWWVEFFVHPVSGTIPLFPHQKGLGFFWLKMCARRNSLFPLLYSFCSSCHGFRKFKILFKKKQKVNFEVSTRWNLCIYVPAILYKKYKYCYPVSLSLLPPSLTRKKVLNPQIRTFSPPLSFQPSSA